MLILGIESTCDETGVAVVENGRKVIANFLASSVQLHAKFGGVVPEVAAREQLKVLVPSLKLVQKKVSLSKVDAIAVSSGPGLIGSLLVGVESAKALSLALNKPLIPVNHLSGHIYSNWLQREVPPKFPLVGLVVSGGHTDLVHMRHHGDFKLLGSTLDDAAGEAFDKAARVMGLPYPGGPEIERVASSVDGITKGRVDTAPLLPRPMTRSNDFNFSFSGLKTAIANLAQKQHLTVARSRKLAFEFQEAVVDSIFLKVKRAIDAYRPKSVVVGGGVAANRRLRERLLEFDNPGLGTYFPLNSYSVDNGAMIAAAAYFAGNRVDPLTAQADSTLHFG